MNEETPFALPGFQSPQSHNLEQRVHTHADGRIDLVFMTGWPAEKVTPKFEVFLCIEASDKKPFLLCWDNSLIYRENEDGGTSRFRLIILPQDLNVVPGNYVLWILQDRKEVFRKSLVVPDSPLRSLRLPGVFPVVEI